MTSIISIRTRRNILRSRSILRRAVENSTANRETAVGITIAAVTIRIATSTVITARAMMATTIAAGRNVLSYPNITAAVSANTLIKTTARAVARRRICLRIVITTARII